MKKKLISLMLLTSLFYPTVNNAESFSSKQDEEATMSKKTEHELFADKQETTISEASNKKTTTGFWGEVQWELDKSTSTLTFISSGNLGNKDNSPWNSWSSDNYVPLHEIKEIIFTKPVVAPEDSSMLFATTGTEQYDGLMNLTKIDGLDKVDTSNVIDMSYMFYYMTSITSIDISSWNTSKVENTSGMFGYCPNLSSLDLSNNNFTSVRSATEMFYDCKNLIELNLATFGSSLSSVNGSSTVNMFYNCLKLKKIVLEHGNFAYSQLPEPNLEDPYADIPYVSGGRYLPWPETPPNKINDYYSGGWIQIGINDPQVYTSSVNFMSNYDGSSPGTYVWEIEGIIGDINKDGNVNLLDLVALRTFLNTGQLPNENVTLDYINYVGDLNKDGNVDLRDYSLLKDLLNH